MSLHAPRAVAGEIADQPVSRAVPSSRTVFTGAVWDVVRETVDLGQAGQVAREFVDHPGSVTVIALRGEAGREEVLLVQQYRHPVRTLLWEAPAGLLDEAGEAPWTAAARELAEEADLTAGSWHVLVDYFSSPGGANEALRVYLARDLADVPEAQRHEREHEEHGMPTRWVDLDEAQAAVLAGRIHNAAAVVGILAAHAARAAGWTTLRPFDAAWPDHPAYRGSDRH